METETPTNPGGGEDTAAATLEANAGVETLVQAEPQYDDDGNPIAEPPDDDEEEFDLDEGLKLKVPKDAAAKLKELREGALRQADYTRKTQELAEERKAVRAERELFGKLSQAELAARVEIGKIDAQIADYETIDWDTWDQTDPQASQRAWRHLQSLKDGRGGAIQQFVQAQQQRTLIEQQETAKRLEQGQQELRTKIPDWSDDKAKALIDYGQTIGFSRQELDSIDDPRMIVALHHALEGKQSKQAASKLANLAKGNDAQPAKVLRGSTGSSPVRADTNDFRAFEKLAQQRLAAK